MPKSHQPQRGGPNFEPACRLPYIRLNTQTPCPPRGAVPVHQGRGERFFHPARPVRFLSWMRLPQQCRATEYSKCHELSERFSTRATHTMCCPANLGNILARGGVCRDAARALCSARQKSLRTELETRLLPALSVNLLTFPSVRVNAPSWCAVLAENVASPVC